MAGFEIPREIREFIRERIDSVAQMEALQLISQSDSNRTWTILEVAQRLYISQTEAAEALHRLCTLDLLSHSGESFGLHGLRPGDRARVDRLATLYKRYLIAVTELIHEKSGRSAADNHGVKS